MPSPRQRTQEHRLILLRTPTVPPEQDPYQLALDRDTAAASWSLHPVKVLDTALVNQDKLRHALENVHCNESPYDGVVVTSARSIHAYRTALASLGDDRLPVAPPRIPFFVVGRPTAAALLALPSAPDPALVLGGAESGTGAALAQFILAHFASLPPGSPPRQRRLLYLTGDKNRDTVPRTLAAGGVRADELQVYATTPAPSFPAALERALAAVPEEGGGAGGQVWVAMFSPSGAREALPVLDALGALPHPLDASPCPSPSSPATRGDDPRALAHLAPRIRIATIGAVTASYLESVGVHVDVAASRPEPEELVSAVLGACKVEQAEPRRQHALERESVDGAR